MRDMNVLCVQTCNYYAMQFVCSFCVVDVVVVCVCCETHKFAAPAPTFRKTKDERFRGEREFGRHASAVNIPPRR